MQVKIFTRSNPNAQRGMRDVELESEINRWLADKPTIEIMSIAQSSATRGETQELVISVWYRTSQEVAQQRLQHRVVPPQTPPVQPTPHVQPAPQATETT